MIKAVEELCEEYDRRWLKEFAKGTEAQGKRMKFLQRVHDIRDFIMWLVVLPVVPIIAIIQAVRGEL